jgi:hypothetical protein
VNKVIAKYSELDQLFGVYLSQDYAYWGDTLEAVLASYMRDSPVADQQILLGDIERFRALHPDDLDAAFSSAYGYDFDPALWDHTTASFFAELERWLLAPVRSTRE